MSTCADTVPTEKWAADNEGESSMNQFWYSAATLSCFVEEITEQGQASYVQMLLAYLKLGNVTASRLRIGSIGLFCPALSASS